jgi:hypothetical protein
MSAPVSYFEVIHNMHSAFDDRLRLASQARQHGIKATARAFSTTSRTVAKMAGWYAIKCVKRKKERGG